MGEEGLSHGMTPAHLKQIRELEKENQKLKELVAEERLAGKLKDELLKNINQDAKNNNNLFNLSLSYKQLTSGTPLFNGNISPN
ncbi:MAG: hypothetical protein ACK5H1_02840 [Tenacibaculum sp.]